VDINTCRVRRACGELADCLAENPQCCQYAMSFGFGFLCRHPDRLEILAKSEAKEREGKDVKRRRNCAKMRVSFQKPVCREVAPAESRFVLSLPDLHREKRAVGATREDARRNWSSP
jgi:hypothetical protein